MKKGFLFNNFMNFHKTITFSQKCISFLNIIFFKFQQNFHYNAATFNRNTLFKFLTARLLFFISSKFWLFHYNFYIYFTNALHSIKNIIFNKNTLFSKIQITHLFFHISLNIHGLIVFFIFFTNSSYYRKRNFLTNILLFFKFLTIHNFIDILSKLFLSYKMF